MKKPIKSSYKTEAGYKRALKKYNDFVKANKTTKKPAAKRGTGVKKPATKKPAGKVPAKKPLISNKNKLRIKKAATTAKDTTVKTAKTVAKKAGQLRQAIVKGKAPAPKTPQQKAVSKAYRGTRRYGKTALKKGGKDLLKIGKGILKNPKSAVKGGLGGIATAVAGDVINRRVDSVFAKRKGMSVDEYRAAKSKALKGKGIVNTAKNIVSKVRGKSGESSTTKNIKKQKKANTTSNSGLKIKKTQYSSNAAKKKQNFGAATGTKKADKRFGTFREGSKENRKLQLERQGGKKETYSRKVSKEAEKTKTKTVKSSGKKMHRIEKENRKIFGDAHVERLKRQHEAFKRRRKKK